MLTRAFFQFKKYQHNLENGAALVVSKLYTIV